MANDILVVMRPAEAEAITQSLHAEGFVLDFATDNLTGADRALSEYFALIILDAAPVSANGIGGIESLRRIRQRSLLPIPGLRKKGPGLKVVIPIEVGRKVLSIEKRTVIRFSIGRTF